MARRKLDTPEPQRHRSLYSLRDGERIERMVRAGNAPTCPRCSELLEIRPDSCFLPDLPHDATAHELVCESCRRFWCIVRESPRSLLMRRMRRLAAAVHDAPLENGSRAEARQAPPAAAGSA